MINQLWLKRGLVGVSSTLRIKRRSTKLVSSAGKSGCKVRVPTSVEVCAHDQDVQKLIKRDSVRTSLPVDRRLLLMHFGAVESVAVQCALVHHVLVHVPEDWP